MNSIFDNRRISTRSRAVPVKILGWKLVGNTFSWRPVVALRVKLHILECTDVLAKDREGVSDP